MRFSLLFIIAFLFVLPCSLQAQPTTTLSTDSLSLQSVYNQAEDIVEYITYSDTPYPVSGLRNDIFKIIFVLILIYTFFIFSTPMLVQFVSIYRTIVYRRRWKTTTQYKEKIIDYMVAQHHNASQLALPTKVNKRVMLEVLYNLIRYVEGADRERLLAIYTQFELEQHLISRIKYSLFYKSYFLKMLSCLSTSSKSVDLLQKMIHHRNSEVRMYAAQAYFAVHPDKIYTYFEQYTYTLSQWEQVNYYYFFKTRQITVPDFRGLLLSKNDSVVMFAARMLRLFYQKKGNVVGLEQLKDHPNILVQIELLRTLAEFGYEDLAHLLPDMMTQVDPYIKQHIITYLAKLQGAKTDQLMAYYNQDASPDFRLHVLFCIYNFVPNGSEDILRFSNQPDDVQLRELSTHLIKNVL